VGIFCSESLSVTPGLGNLRVEYGWREGSGMGGFGVNLDSACGGGGGMIHG